MSIPTLHGNTNGLKHSESKSLLSLYDRSVEVNSWISAQLARRLTELSREVSRQLGLMIDRRGRITHVIVGDAHQLYIPELGRNRAGGSRFRGIRLIHTHIRGEPLSRDDLTDLALLRLDAVAVVQSTEQGLPGEVEVATVSPESLADKSREPWKVSNFESVHSWPQDFIEVITDLETQVGRAHSASIVDGEDGCIVIGVTTGNLREANDSLDELERLAHTAQLQVSDRILQRRSKLDGKYVIGKGKLQEILVRAMQLHAEVLVFDRELSPSQLRNIATATDLRVVDRTQVILDIFAQRAKSKEGKLQVELAQLRYRRPRMALMPTAMSRLTGGIGGRGPGETKLEINKRRAMERQTRLEKELKKLGKHRALRRHRRKRVGLPAVAIVGYTNAGKSTLLNKMTNSTVDAEDKLFATLDPTSRRLRFPEEREVILTDTVGFIRNLPKDLVHAFKATLEEASEADLLIHVADASSPQLETHISEVNKTLESIGAADTPVMMVLNKCDAVKEDLWAELAEQHQAMMISAQADIGLKKLMLYIERQLFIAKAQSQTAQD